MSIIHDKQEKADANERDMISIVVPVYNVEQYIGRCIESLIGQTYENIEIILVDDGSEDASGAICDQYSEREHRIITIHKENGGLSDARNAGILCAKGNMITFVDSDDFVHPDYISTLYHNMTEYEADISICRYVQTRENSAKEDRREGQNIYSRTEGLERLLYQYISTSVCAKMYKTELFHGVLFPYGKLYEDVVTIFLLFKKANRIVLSDRCLYYYYIRGDSIIHAEFTKKKFDYIENTKYILEDVRNEYPALEKAALSRVLWADVHVVVQIGRDNRYAEMQSEIWNEVKKYRKAVLADPKSRWQNKAVLLISFLGRRVTCGVYGFSRLSRRK